MGRRVIAAPPPVRGPLVAGLTSSSCLFFFSFSCAGRFWVDRSGKICSFGPALWVFPPSICFDPMREIFFLAALPGVFVGDANTLS